MNFPGRPRTPRLLHEYKHFSGHGVRLVGHKLLHSRQRGIHLSPLSQNFFHLPAHSAPHRFILAQFQRDRRGQILTPGRLDIYPGNGFFRKEYPLHGRQSGTGQSILPGWPVLGRRG